jgi:hypothetical protein
MHKRARIDDECPTIAGLPNEIWAHILTFAVEWLQLPFVCQDFCAIFDRIHYEPKRRLTPKARVMAIERSTEVFIERIAQFRPISTDLLNWLIDSYTVPINSTGRLCVLSDTFLCSFARSGGTADEMEELDRGGECVSNTAHTQRSRPPRCTPIGASSITSTYATTYTRTTGLCGRCLESKARRSWNGHRNRATWTFAGRSAAS